MDNAGTQSCPPRGLSEAKDLKKTIGRLLGYLTRSKLPLLAGLGLPAGVGVRHIGGSYMLRGIINDFIWSGCTDFAGLGRAILGLIGVYL